MLEMKPEGLSSARARPRSPNIQNYRPQLTSVLSIANRITALASMVAFVAWLIAAELSPRAYEAMHTAAASPIGRALLVIATFAFFLHLCGSVRHLVWDSARGFELRAIYISGWVAVVASVVLTAAAWVTGLLLKG